MRYLVVLMFAFSLLFAQSSVTYVGSKNSDKYHLQSCRSAKKIASHNLVKFKSIQEAEANGYIPCKVCKPKK